MRAVNGRFLDLALRLPESWRSLEPQIRAEVAKAVRRGKVEVRVAIAGEADGGWPTPTPEQLNRLARLESTVQGWLPKAAPLSVHEALQWCRSGGSAAAGTVSGAGASDGGGAGVDTPEDDGAFLATLRTALERLRAARAGEGAKLAAMLVERISALRALADAAEPLVPAVVQRQQARFVERFQQALAGAESAAAESGNPAVRTPIAPDAARERALTEAAAYAIRIDVAEELSRLRAHLDEIARLLEQGGEVGKRLDFLIQELHREANTLGSKSTALELSAIAVDMKVQVEQMREQVQNIE